MLFIAFKMIIATAGFLFASFAWQAQMMNAGQMFLFERLAIQAREQQAIFDGPQPDTDFSPQKDLRRKAGPYLLAKKPQNLSVSASSCLALDVKSESILYAKDAERPQPIASITKLMTALVFLDNNPGWSKEYILTDDDKRDGGKVYFFPGDKVKVKDLFFAMLVASDNAAVAGLMHSTGMTEAEFVAKMNAKAKELGLAHTSFADPTGLNNNNISTAKEVAVFAREALARPQIQEAVLAEGYDFATADGKIRSVRSTDKLLSNRGEEVRIEGGKTGYLQSAGYCFVGRFSKDQHEIMTVVLGAPDINARFSETKKVVSWVYDNYRWFE